MREYVESVQMSPVDMQNTWKKIVSNLNKNDTIPHSVRLVDPVQRISCGYGILPSTICKALHTNQNIQDWGTEEYFKQGSSIKNYFYWR